MSDAYDPDLEDDFDTEDPPEDDLDDEDDEALDDPEDTSEEEDDEPAAQPQRQSQRKPFAQRVEEVAERVAAKKTADLQRELDALKSAQSQPTRESAAARQQRLDEMDPLERRLYLSEEREAAREFQTNERLDKMAFDALCDRNPQASKLRSEVERELSALRARGQNVDRETMLKYVIGERALRNAPRATNRAAKQAATNRAQQQARPGNARADTATPNRRGGNDAAARAKRLDGMNI